ncbi:hypothetical protein KAI92_00060 [Candidatus Parcubacteria bacterium]|nr:hypothetical protein [Candidatus Parcubacteria bacterium]
MSEENNNIKEEEILENKVDKTETDDKSLIKTKEEKERVAAALSYVWILCLVPLLGNRDSKFAQFHAKQGLVIFALETVGVLFYWFPLFGQVLALAFLVISVLGAVKAYNGEWWKIPYVYDWSKKIKF